MAAIECYVSQFINGRPTELSTFLDSVFSVEQFGPAPAAITAEKEQKDLRTGKFGQEHNYPCTELSPIFLSHIFLCASTRAHLLAYPIKTVVMRCLLAVARCIVTADFEADW